MPTTHADHDRTCMYATEAMEAIRDVRQHASTCAQCRTDPKYCQTNIDYLGAFERSFNLWHRYRGSGGVMTHIERNA